jgi:hypothetical protein
VNPVDLDEVENETAVEAVMSVMTVAVEMHRQERRGRTMW